MGAHRSRVPPRRRLVAAIAASAALVLVAMLLSVASRDHAPTGPPAGAVASRTSPPSGAGGLGAAPEPSPPPASGPPTPAPAEPDPGAGSGRQPPAPAATGRILVGANVQTRDGEHWQDANARADDDYGPLQMHRVFYPELPPAWPGSRAAGDGRPVVVSFKADPAELLAGRHDGMLADWFAGAPHEQDIYWVYHHEPENNIEAGEFTAADYRRAWRRVADLAARADHPRLFATLVLMCWTLEPGSGRDWRDYYPGPEVIAVLGWDCYNSGGYRNGTYADPESRFALAIEVSRAEGKPWGIAEMGSRLVPGDESGQRRGAWLRAIGEHLAGLDHPPLWVAYFDSTTGGDFRLLDSPSRAAWREFARSQQP